MIVGVGDIDTPDSDAAKPCRVVLDDAEDAIEVDLAAVRIDQSDLDIGGVLIRVVIGAFDVTVATYTVEAAHRLHEQQVFAGFDEVQCRVASDRGSSEVLDRRVAAF